MARKITMNEQFHKPLEDVFEDFVISKIDQGVADVAVATYRHHISNISNHLDIQKPVGKPNLAQSFLFLPEDSFHGCQRPEEKKTVRWYIMKKPEARSTISQTGDPFVNLASAVYV